MRDRPALRYVGTDVSPQLLEHARQATQREDWRFELVQGPVVPVADGVADVVAMFSVITHLAEVDARAYFAEIARILKPKGAAVVSFLDPSVPEHRRQIRPGWIEAIVTRIAWAPNVATPVHRSCTAGPVRASSRSTKCGPAACATLPSGVQRILPGWQSPCRRMRFYTWKVSPWVYRRGVVESRLLNCTAILASW